MRFDLEHQITITLENRREVEELNKVFELAYQRLGKLQQSSVFLDKLSEFIHQILEIGTPYSMRLKEGEKC